MRRLPFLAAAMAAGLMASPRQVIISASSANTTFFIAIFLREEG